ncbi:hypothetical protein [Priestia megaterium]|uniref:hypothetical protein n=1 Tax=Priestia megaterium TaxID=1404 RepID=UPI000BF61A8B|nr:hypothetical protein [Priestia megaterium]MDP1443253.1 hypothetical protein [Priestia megaterium]MDP1472406.1 hypothetical protein [Priestia megaterium]PFK65063.1 hypothetical protein COJ21_24925 [Priestia megaterium]
MKKIMLYSGICSLILLFAIGLYITNDTDTKTEATVVTKNPINTEKVKITNPIVKDYIKGSLENWTSSDSSRYYLNKYRNDIKHVEIRYAKNEDISIELFKIKNAKENEYNHIVKIKFAHRIVILNEKQKLDTTDTLTYKININLFAMNDSTLSSDNKIIKLVNYDHKEN